MADDCVWDSWEDFVDSEEMEKHVEEGLNTQHKDDSSIKFQKTLCHRNNKLASSKERSDLPQTGIKILQRPIIIHEEDQNRTAYKPPLKILKRPEKITEEQRHAEDLRRQQQAQQPVRTLAQREAAYLEARQRIMGVEMNNTGDMNVKQPGLSLDARPDNLKGYSKQIKSLQKNGTAEVKRQPKGPNGKGFRNN